MRPNLVSGGLAGLHPPVAPTQFLFTPQSSFASQHPPPAAAAAPSLYQPPHPYGLYTPPEETVTGSAMGTSPIQYHSAGVASLSFREQSGTGYRRSGVGGGDGNVVVQNTRQQQPLTSHVAGSCDERGNNNEVASYLQVPPSINNSKGSLAVFAARIACLFWFGSVPELRAIEDGSSQHVPPPTSDAVASLGFQKWVTTILVTTQVSQNVILLALLFIYRLRISHPQVVAKRGSEFRLITVGLMMGNKFLDDSTYTNKTWAEVAGLSVPEIHVMEVEFLSNLRYNLFVSVQEWERWHKKLGLFAQYLDQLAHSHGHENLTRTSPYPVPPYGTPVSPKTNRPVALDLGHSLRPLTDYATRHRPWDRASTLATRQGETSFAELAEPGNPNRKRGRDWEAEDHPAKRLSVRGPVAAPTVSSTLIDPTARSYTLPGAAAPPASLASLPAVSFVDSRLQPGTASASNGFYTVNASSYPTTNPSLSSRITAHPVALESSQPTSISTTCAPLLNLDLHHDYTSLPPLDAHLGPSMPSSGAARTLDTPSVVYDRHSPYRPVVNVHSLLYPPPVTIYPPRRFSRDQMHYQPLSKVIRETKSGVLPYYPPGLGTNRNAQIHYPSS